MYSGLVECVCHVGSVCYGLRAFGGQLRILVPEGGSYCVQYAFPYGVSSIICDVWAWKEVNVEAVSFNVADYHYWNFLTAGSRGRRRGRGVGLVVWRLCFPAHTGNEVSCGMDDSGLVECVCSVATWVLCLNCGLGCRLPVARRHLTELRH